MDSKTIVTVSNFPFLIERKVQIVFPLETIGWSQDNALYMYTYCHVDTSHRFVHS